MSSASEKQKLARLLLLFAAILMPLGSAVPALAIPPATDNISTCAALNTLGANPAAAADTINLTANLDCTGVSFVAMFGSGFSGMFDGRGHSISHLTINMPGNYNVGLFSSVVGGTIQDLALASGSVTGSNGTGALVGGVDHITVSNVTSAVSVHSSSDQLGGLIGILNGTADSLIQDVTVTGSVTDTGSGMSGGTSVGGLIGYLGANNDRITIRRTSYAGDVQANNYFVGGFVGDFHVTGSSQPASVTIQDSYTAGHVSSPNSQGIGGILGRASVNDTGAAGSLSLAQVYSTADVHGSQEVGGLVGYGGGGGSAMSFTITNSFTAGPVTAVAGVNTGSMVGYNAMSSPSAITSANNYYDGPATFQTICSGNTSLSGTCTRIDTSATPNYFLGNHTSAPLASSWDFATTWSTQPGSYPTLIPRDDGDGILLAQEGSGPNTGDANGDGINDAAQPDVASFPDPVSGHYAAIQTSCGSFFNVQIGAEAAAPSGDVAYNYPAGLVQFVVTGCTPGATATITQYFYGNYDPATFIMRKSVSISGAITYTTIPGAIFSTVTIGGQPALKVVYQITDGSSLDQDGTSDGNITDPAGPAVNVLAVPNTGLGGLSR